MSRTVTALYDSRAEAEAARQRLSSAVDVERVNVIDQESRSSGQSGKSDLDGYYMSQEDRHSYDEGIKRGGFLLCAEVDGDEDADRIVQALEETSSVDLDRREESWRSEGWTPYAGSGAGGFGNSQPQAAQSGSPTGGGVEQEERIPVIEEELRVGKREVERGGARVRSYIREEPVHEQVTLREEHVQVERRPVDQAAGTAATGGFGTAVDADMLQERTVEMREMAEEAVVQKVANVREEVVVTKTAEQRTEQIDDTVRRTEVEVDEGKSDSSGRSAFGSFGEASGSASAEETARERDPSRTS